MKNPKFLLKYSVNGAVYEDSHAESKHYTAEITVEDSGIKAVLTPKREIELISAAIVFEHDYDEDEKFFVNGYQSWTTSMEMGRQDSYRGFIKLANIAKQTKDMAVASGDYLFTDYEKRPGFFHSFSYTYLRRGAEFELFGSLSERGGYTIFYADMERSTFSVKRDVEGVTASSPITLIDVRRFEGEYDEVFDKYFAAMELPERRMERLSGYTSWYNYFQKIDENIILRDLKGIARAKEAVTIFQIDDGYEPFVGDWLDPSPKFPNGMKYIADEIHKEGYLAGIWLAPFNAQKKSRMCKEHHDWLIKEPGGKPQLGCMGWGGAYTLDLYNEEVREHLRHVFDVVLNDWGYDMVKLDFLYSQCITPRAGKSRGEIMCDAMDFLRECVGDKLLLGCGVPLVPAFGAVDACRISCDVDLKYTGKFYNALHLNNELPSAQLAINNTIFRRHLNNRAFSNDPDVFFLRENNLTFTREQKLLLAKINSLFGRVLFVSDNVGDYSEEDVELVKKIFTAPEVKILEAGYKGAVEQGDMEIKYEENGEEKALRFNLKTGESNVKELI